MHKLQIPNNVYSMRVQWLIVCRMTIYQTFIKGKKTWRLFCQGYGELQVVRCRPVLTETSVCCESMMNGTEQVHYWCIIWWLNIETLALRSNSCARMGCGECERLIRKQCFANRESDIRFSHQRIVFGSQMIESWVTNVDLSVALIHWLNYTQFCPGVHKWNVWSFIKDLYIFFGLSTVRQSNITKQSPP